jgi:HPt (histidine-containing phosphotransfer) domain-containing protein
MLCKWACILELQFYFFLGEVTQGLIAFFVLRCRNDRDLPELSSLGHFLKGSSATLGLTKVRDCCEKIQHFGQMKDEAGTTDEPDEAECLERIKETLAVVKEEYAEVEKVLKKFYEP